MLIILLLHYTSIVMLYSNREPYGPMINSSGPMLILYRWAYAQCAVFAGILQGTGEASILCCKSWSPCRYWGYHSRCEDVVSLLFSLSLSPPRVISPHMCLPRASPSLPPSFPSLPPSLSPSLPGSMPPHSVKLWEEGMCCKSFKLVKGGIFQEEGVWRCGVRVCGGVV